MELIEFKKNGGIFWLKLVHIITRRKVKRQLYSSRSTNITHTARRINSIMNGKPFKYLEIGVAYGLTFEGVKAQLKCGVDPDPKFNLQHIPTNCEFYKLNSDEFFHQINDTRKYDFIFLDGLHEINQLIRDLVNCIKIINQNSWILIDDVVPFDSISAINDLEVSKNMRKLSNSPEFIGWHGDCFKIIELIANKFHFFDYYLIIYPDNPQLLLKIKDGYSINDINLEDVSVYYDFVGGMTFERNFTSKKLRELPIYLEEILVKELKN
jgi:hypothetical protein